eukprot:Seg1115.6 transcript_id=Seg1115.6/GoldUCD/mRNA.D3Y31 product="hypothetical protein" protein_id=Seg1115.6/GoldUCD/D3Y31
MKNPFCLAALFLLMISFDKCMPLRCQVCGHTKSWKYCERYKSIQTCPKIPNRTPNCYKLEKSRNHLNNTRDYSFSMGCISSTHCSVSYMCTSKDKCKLNCCDTNLCNSARNSIPILHGFLTTMATVFVIMFSTL